jgi:hypothetical protein
MKVGGIQDREKGELDSMVRVPSSLAADTLAALEKDAIDFWDLSILPSGGAPN